MVHIIPVKDCADHIEEVSCPCCPRFITMTDGSTAVLHSRFDWDDDDEERGNNPPPEQIEEEYA